MNDEPTIKIAQSEYRALTNIAITAEQYLRSGSTELAEELRDAVLVSRIYSDDDVEDEVKLTLRQDLVDFVDEEMILIIENSDIADVGRASEIRRAIQDLA